MPKDKGMPSLSFDRSRASPYSCCSKNTEQCRSKNPLLTGDEKEWEEDRCPICMEHPHNAVLLLCSSHDEGCRAYICDTSYRHSNCLDQFCKSCTTTSPTDLTVEVSLSGAVHHGRGDELRQQRPGRVHGGPLQPKLFCPLCRGQVNGWIIMEPARRFMNSKPRCCALETCDFSGTYSELRKHARLEHPSVRPSETDSRRQRDWMRLERERDYLDVLSALYPVGPVGELDDNFIPDEASAERDSIGPELPSALVLGMLLVFAVSSSLGVGDQPDSRRTASRVPGSSGVSDRLLSRRTTERVPGSSGVTGRSRSWRTTERVPGFSGVTGRSRSWRTTARVSSSMWDNNHSESLSVGRRSTGDYMSWGSMSNRGQRRSNQRSGDYMSWDSRPNRGQRRSNQRWLSRDY